MLDHFATLGQPRRPWLDTSVVKNAFHRLSTTLHPDVPGTGDADRFALLNAAHSVLKEPATRVRHLLELVAPAALGANASPPPELADLFMDLASLQRRHDELLAKHNAAASPLARALLAGDKAALRREFETALRRLDAAESAAAVELWEIDRVWEEVGVGDGAALVLLYRRFAYLRRWHSKTDEAWRTLPD